MARHRHGQHRYPCTRCARWGTAHYLLVAGQLLLVCTACFAAAKKAGHRDTAAPVGGTDAATH